ncbi:uncharacterized protein LOC107304930 [Oryza brachyantha]|uniref:uncharacterized protein LOC107304930 n=1 Tax=Oryza brachyantha TaxID=4533 RepID=UPI000776975D|nr:uncharacterized protein LOC107304930 [Oryza brachyantha]
MSSSSKQNEFEVDRIEHYRYMISKLIENEGSLSTQVSGEVQDSITQDNAKEGQGFEKSFPFAEGISDLSEFKKEGLKIVLHEVVSFFANAVEKVSKEIRAMEENGETHQEAVKKFSAELLEKLDKMARGVDDMLDILASKCRSMTTAEKL